MTPDLDVAVVGAGVAGLSAAYALTKAGRSVRVFEAADAVGGRMRTVHHDGYALDTGAEQLATHGYEHTWALLRELGIPLDDAPLIGKPLAVWRDGKAHSGVADPRGLVTGAGLGLRARFELGRLMATTAWRQREFDPDHPEATPLGSATIAQLAQLHHPDLGDYLLQPVVSSFFGWSPKRSAAGPYLSLMTAVGPVSGWRTYRGGMDTLARGLAERVEVVPNSPVRQVESLSDGALITTDVDTVTAGSVVLCVPAPVASALHVNPAAEAVPFLAASTYSSVLKVGCLLDRPLAPTARRPLYALLIPQREDRNLACVIADHVKQPDRAPAGRGLLSLIAAPPATRELLDAPDDEVSHRLLAAAEHYVPGATAATRTALVHRFRYGLPEATPAALAARPGFLRRPLASVEYAGDWVMARPASEGALRAAAIATE
ncbi:MAG: protoporphyrinogen/coproporphyrinogen oxidase, partial [Stackebrandtia sp.]